jgi:ribonuclease-3
VYLDGGWDAANGLVLRLLAGRIAEAAAGPGGHDYKTRLQELAARRFDRLPRYQVSGHGPDHAKRFFATVLLDGEPRGSGEGRSKKQAEQAAAKAAWLWLRELGVDEDLEGGVTDDVGVPSGELEHPNGAADSGVGKDADAGVA